MTEDALSRGSGEDRLRGILDLVEGSLDEPDLGGADLAGRAYLSRFHFDRLVRAALGEAPGTFRRRVLLERAAYRLTVSGDKVIDVGLDAGYASPEAFTRAFVRAYGIPPTDLRRRPRASLELPAPSGVHFHPPGSLRLPAESRSSGMDVLLRMIDHHIWLTGEIVDRMGDVDPAVLDQPIALSVEGIDVDPTLRSVTARLVAQLEMWADAVEGATTMPADGERTPAELRQRLDAVVPRFRSNVVTPLTEGRADETFIDAVCEPPETFTYAGVVAHVLTFAAVRRTMAIGALESAGVTDLGSGDPMHYVGGTGPDASTITRTKAG